MDITTEEHDGITIIHLSGDLSIDTISIFETECNKELNFDPEIIAFNFQEVSHIDSISINHLFKLSKKAQLKNVQLIIYGLTEGIRQTLEVIKMDKVYLLLSKEKFEEDYLNI